MSHNFERTIAFEQWKNNAFDVNDHHTARQLAVDREALHEFGIDRDRSVAVHAQCFAHARNKKKQRDARIANDVPKAVNAVVAWPIGYRERLVVEDSHKTRGVAFGRAIHTFRS